MQLLHGIKVLHGNEGLLPAERSREAVYLTELWSCALPEGRPDPELFDLFKGGLMLVEAVDAKKLPLVRVAMEVKFLATLGLLPETDRCVECGGSLARGAWLGPPAKGGFLCAAHRAGSTLEVPPAGLSQLSTLAAAKGREIPGLSLTPSSLTKLTGRLIERALERHVSRPGGRRP
jgi:recombinational DNA repair protein (RecF pathway)